MEQGEESQGMGGWGGVAASSSAAQARVRMSTQTYMFRSVRTVLLFDRFSVHLHGGDDQLGLRNAHGHRRGSIQGETSSSEPAPCRKK